jgi:hypothetical protein
MLDLELPPDPMGKGVLGNGLDLKIVVENRAVEMLGPVGMALDSTPLTDWGQHDDERALGLPYHDPKVHAGCAQGS